MDMQTWRHLSEDAERAVLAKADYWLQSAKARNRRAALFAWLALRTGARISELAELDWIDVDFNRRSIRVRRRKRRQLVKDDLAIPNDLLVRLLPFRQPAGPLFRNTRPARRFDSLVRLLESDWHRLLAAAGAPPLSAHSARHTVAVRMREAGLSAFDIRDQLGHADVSTSNLYVARDPLRLRSALEAVWS